MVKELHGRLVILQVKVFTWPIVVIKINISVLLQICLHDQALSPNVYVMGCRIERLIIINFFSAKWLGNWERDCSLCLIDVGRPSSSLVFII